MTERIRLVQLDGKIPKTLTNLTRDATMPAAKRITKSEDR